MGSIGAYGTNIPIAISKNNISSMVDISYAYHATRSFDHFLTVGFFSFRNNSVKIFCFNSTSTGTLLIVSLFN